MEEAFVFALFLTFIAGASTGIGSLIAFFVKGFKKKHLSFALGLSAGVMIYVSFVELLGRSIADIGFIMGNAAFFVGIVTIMLADFLIPHSYIDEHAGHKHLPKGGKERKLLSAGMMTALGLAIHNFPEGLAVFMGSLQNINLGITLMFAIAIHNIPEGIAVSMPLYYSTKNRKKSFIISFLSGIAEPVGAIVGIVILYPFLNAFIMSFLLAFVAGIMVFISFDELLPLSYEDKETGHVSIFGMIIGMLIMALSLAIL